jgi:hypothetical protein
MPHELSQPEALQRVKSLLEKIKAEHEDKITNLQQNWNGSNGLFSFQVMGFAVSGALHVGEKSVELDSEIPLPAMLFKNKIKSIIEDEGKKLLA